MRTVVCQSYRTDDVPAWVERCLTSVRDWAAARDFTYRFEGDDILARVPAPIRDKAAGRWPVLTDVARLHWLAALLDEGFERAIWLDADVLVFAPDRFDLPENVTHAFGRELWVQAKGQGFQVRRNVHNAMIMMTPDNPVLGFYIHAAEQVLARIDGGFPDQVVGPKLLGHLHNVVDFPLIDAVGMFSPPVVADIAAGGGAALAALNAAQETPPAAANLCSSMVEKDCDGVTLDGATLLAACDRLQASSATLFKYQS